MQTAQTIIKNYRRKRVIVCVTVALLTLILTLGIRFISQRNVNQQRILSISPAIPFAHLKTSCFPWITADRSCWILSASRAYRRI